jgi:hypothetical protein
VFPIHALVAAARLLFSFSLHSRDRTTERNSYTEKRKKPTSNSQGVVYIVNCQPQRQIKLVIVAMGVIAILWVHWKHAERRLTVLKEFVGIVKGCDLLNWIFYIVIGVSCRNLRFHCKWTELLFLNSERVLWVEELFSAGEKAPSEDFSWESMRPHEIQVWHVTSVRLISGFISASYHLPKPVSRN